MHHFKEIIHFLDYTFAIVWGFTVYPLCIDISAGDLFSTSNTIMRLT